MDKGRFFLNPYIDKDIIPGKDIKDKFIKAFFEQWEEYEKTLPTQNILSYNHTIYTGASGLVFLYLNAFIKLKYLDNNHHVTNYLSKNFLFKNPNDMNNIFKTILIKSESILNFVLIDIKKIKLKDKILKPSLINGFTGPYCLGFIIYDIMYEYEKRDECVKNIIDFKGKFDEMSAKHSLDCDKIQLEILYGLSGYILALINIYHYIQHTSKEIRKRRNTFDQSLITDNNEKDRKLRLAVHTDNIINTLYEVATKIIHDFQKYSKTVHSPSPLMMIWHEKEYVGAAHGILGVLYALLQVASFNILKDKHLKSMEATLDYLSSTNVVYASGNFPSSLPPVTDKLVQWCHGAPGAIYTYLKAAQIYPLKREQYLNVALKCGNCIWERGLLAKSYGLCHGISGNAYSFLALYNFTNDSKHLHRAYKFGEFLLEQGCYKFKLPDHPFSLYEGLAGLLVFYQDLINPETARFPMYEIYDVK